MFALGHVREQQPPQCQAPVRDRAASARRLGPVSAAVHGDAARPLGAASLPSACSIMGQGPAPPWGTGTQGEGQSNGVGPCSRPCWGDRKLEGCEL